ncbi:MAG: hypothetical protein QW734_05445 [Candidatus Bathyarchaeia archaeon]
MEKKIKYIFILSGLIFIFTGLYFVFSSLNIFGISAKILWVSGTEYQHGEKGSVIIRVVDVYGNPVHANYCNITIFYPDGSVFVNDEQMTRRTNPPSTFVYDFVTTFDVIGNYHAFVKCEALLPGNRPIILYADKAFHVSQTLSAINDTMSATIRILT